MQEKALSEVLGIVRRIAAPPDKEIQWIPIDAAKLTQCSLPTHHLALRRNHDQSPARGMKLSAGWFKFRFHDFASGLSVAKRQGIRNKNSGASTRDQWCQWPECRPR